MFVMICLLPVLRKFVYCDFRSGMIDHGEGNIARDGNCLNTKTNQLMNLECIFKTRGNDLACHVIDFQHFQQIFDLSDAVCVIVHSIYVWCQVLCTVHCGKKCLVSGRANKANALFHSEGSTQHQKRNHHFQKYPVFPVAQSDHVKQCALTPLFKPYRYPFTVSFQSKQTVSCHHRKQRSSKRNG